MPRSKLVLAHLGRRVFGEHALFAHRHRPAAPPPAGLTEPARRPSGAPHWWDADPRWYRGGTAPQRENRITPLVDGARYLAALEAALSTSRHYVYIAAWCLSPYLPLNRGDAAALVDSRLALVLAEVARRVPVRILLWGGAPVLYEPSRRSALAVQAALAPLGGDLQCRLDRTARFSHTHHQKAVVIDGQVAFLGGMDLTTLSGDRWDTPAHPLRAGLNWHDVQAQIEGAAVADVEANFVQRWAAVTGDRTLPRRAPILDPTWQTPAQIVRTVPTGVYAFARRGEYGIHHAYTWALAQARRLIYLENQYLWAPEIMDALVSAIERPRPEPFRVVIVLPAKAGDGKWDNDKHVQALRGADGGRGLLSIYTLYASGPTGGRATFAYRPIYVHAKVAIIDDEWLTIGSANLNNRGLLADGEMNVVAADPALARALRAELWAEHLGLPVAEVAVADPLRLVDTVWRARAATNARLMRARRRPLQGAVMRYEPGAMPGDFLLEDLESLTFEH